MLTYREADEYTAPDVEAALQANPAIYWAIKLELMAPMSHA